jgi:hypothetical protein
MQASFYIGGSFEDWWEMGISVKRGISFIGKITKKSVTKKSEFKSRKQTWRS